MQDDLHNLAGGDYDGVSLHAGFPNPAFDALGRRSVLALDLNQLLVKHPSSTYLFRVAGEEWAEQGIFDGDIAVIDRALKPRTTDLVITWDGEQFVLCLLGRLSKRLQPWGVVSATIHDFKKEREA